MKYVNYLASYFCSIVCSAILKKDLDKIKWLISRDIDKISAIPEHIIPPLVLAEDHRFFRHPGFDIISIFRAVLYSIFSSIQGGSTIDQQLVRTITQEKKVCLKRKLKEIFLATALNSFFEKNVIAKSYIYYAYYGWKMNGYHEAMLRISMHNEFNIERELFLIALLKYPLPQIVTVSRFQKIADRKKMLSAALKRGKYENLRLGKSGLWS